ncbi:type II toxin-antitoxin system RelE family toxin [Azospirillum brasilense]|uniref:type II toxin-antitoxin system RelE family toxin n=1 Tax=Azospirillum brasilense TaxID=192 RepID=UPI001555EC11|nr:hypothetical protein [Azospirillum brasilense]
MLPLGFRRSGAGAAPWLRVGDYRVLFTVAAGGTMTVMLVHRVRHRRKAYD